jgi:putative transposase
VFSERLWRSVKYEEIYLKEYATVSELEEGLARYFDSNDHRWLHQALGYRAPWEVYRSCLSA